MSDELPQPLGFTRPKAEVEKGYQAFDIDRCRDPLWHFRIALRPDVTYGPSGLDAPTREAPFQSLGFFKRKDVPAEIEVFGQLLEREIDPADWLDRWLEENGMTAVSRRRQPTSGGAAGDVVAAWDAKEGPFAGRFFAMKCGQRLFLIGQWAPRGLYAQLADEFLLTMATLQPIDSSTGGILAEPCQTLSSQNPAPWKIRLTQSWVRRPEFVDTDTTASFQATQAPMDGSDAAALLGELTVAVIARGAAATPDLAASAFLSALRDRRVKFEGNPFVEAPAAPPFQQAWLLVSEARVNQKPCEVRCSVMAHEKAWLVAGVLGPTRPVNALAWMQNKRTLDVLAATLEFQP